jgi:hypothetical protein
VPTISRDGAPAGGAAVRLVDVRATEAEHALSLDDDMDAFSRGWIETAWQRSRRGDVGVVGSRLRRRAAFPPPLVSRERVGRHASAFVGCPAGKAPAGPR